MIQHKHKHKHTVKTRPSCLLLKFIPIQHGVLKDIHVYILKHLSKFDRRMVAMAQGCKVITTILIGVASYKSYYAILDWLRPQYRITDNVFWNHAMTGAADSNSVEMTSHCIRNGATFNKVALYFAVKKGNVHVLEMFPPEFLTPTTLDIAIGYNSGAMDWLYEKGIRWSTPAATISQYECKVESYQWLIAHGYIITPVDAKTMCISERNVLPVLELLHKCSPDIFTPDVVSAAVRSGKLSCLKWLHAQQLDFSHTGKKATSRKSLTILEWLYSIGVRAFPFRSTNPRVLKWLYKKELDTILWNENIPRCGVEAMEFVYSLHGDVNMDNTVWRSALRTGPEVIKWLHTHNCPHEGSYRALRLYKRMGTFDALLECKIEPSSDDIKRIIQASNCVLIDWLHAHAFVSVADVERIIEPMSRPRGYADVAKWIEAKKANRSI